MATSTLPKHEQMDFQNLALVAKEAAVDTINFSTDNLANPGTKAGTPAAFDKALKVTVDGIDYWTGLYNTNDAS